MSMKSLGRLRGVGWNACVGGGGYARCFSMGSRRETDGVYRELTAMRTRVPFIEAWRKEEAKRKGKEEDMEKEKRGEMQKVVKGGEGEGLEMKRMKDSFHRVILPLASDPWLLDNYITASGHIRLGAIFMDLDALAGVISYKHTGDRVMTVTAAVDRITLSRPLLEICDLELSGQVTFATGRSSMEVSLQVCKVPSAGQENQPRRKEDVFMECAFTMVSLDPVTKKAVRIAGVQPEGEVEEAWFERGRKSYDKKKRELGRGLRSMEPDDEESDLIHRLWLKTLDYHDYPSDFPPTPSSSTLFILHSLRLQLPPLLLRHPHQSNPTHPTPSPTPH
ncbi:hypothetical protein BGAL_0397g00130 [Botrytis galanthina]|uniref:HotDog ACOT-type domain-containing protein n=1 Tax=Botrytis galanthina TaxID=278940 RepID=A0A4S8QMQ8_9HELO|nr:hypothetical protein BGAL_0397g00130 [Botrytis galanthina]